MRHSAKIGASGAAAIFFVLLGSNPTGAQPRSQVTNSPSPSANHANVQLIAEEDSFRPGHTLWVGLHFELDSGWHIYWRNPGDSGEPPRVEWNLPAGFQAGSLEWPAPIRLGSGSIIDYGYERQALLMSPLRIAAGVKAAAPVTIGASVKYLVCREICIPGKAEVTLVIPPAAKDSSGAHFSQWRKLFAQTRDAWPRPIPAGWKISARSQADNFIIAVQGAAPRRAAVFFPLDADVIENSALQVLASSAAGFQLMLQKSDQLTKPIAVLRGVLLLDADKAYEISVPIAPR